MPIFSTTNRSNLDPVYILRRLSPPHVKNIMSNLIRETLLPNGMKVFYLVSREISVIYDEVQEYFRNGIELHEGDTVFDVGANIGLFTLWVYQLCNKNVNVYAFEPIPAIFEVLQRNAQRFDPQTQKLKVFPCGLSRESKMTTFAYHPNAPAWSNAYPDDWKQDWEEKRERALLNYKDAPPHIRRLRWVPPFLRSLIVNYSLKKLFATEMVSCQMRTISDILREQNVQRIDLLKVDVEKDELEVLLGIEEPDWPKIKQVFLEVHDIDGRLQKIIELLKRHELSEITVTQEGIFKGSNIFALYALKRKSARNH